MSFYRWINDFKHCISIQCPTPSTDNNIFDRIASHEHVIKKIRLQRAMLKPRINSWAYKCLTTRDKLYKYRFELLNLDKEILYKDYSEDYNTYIEERGLQDSNLIYPIITPIKRNKYDHIELYEVLNALEVIDRDIETFSFSNLYLKIGGEEIRNYDILMEKIGLFKYHHLRYIYQELCKAEKRFCEESISVDYELLEYRAYMRLLREL